MALVTADSVAVPGLPHAAAGLRSHRGGCHRARARGWLVAILVLLAGVLAPFAATLARDDSAPTEQRVKAAFLYKFAAFVEWPAGTFAQSDSPLVFGVRNNDTIADELAQLVAGRLVATHPLQVRRLRDGDAVAGVHVLFISAATSPPLADVIDTTRQSPVLVVTESAQALAVGSIINFVLDDGHVRFEISVASAEQRQLKLSSRLLAVAQNLRNEGRE